MSVFNAIIEGMVRLLKAHKPRHQKGGGDEIDLTELAGKEIKISAYGDGGEIAVVQNRLHYYGDDGNEYFIQGARADRG